MAAKTHKSPCTLQYCRATAGSLQTVNSEEDEAAMFACLIWNLNGFFPHTEVHFLSIIQRDTIFQNSGKATVEQKTVNPKLTVLSIEVFCEVMRILSTFHTFVMDLELI